MATRIHRLQIETALRRDVFTAPHPDMPWVVGLASGKGARRDFIEQIPGVNSVHPHQGGPERRTTQTTAIALEKARFALENFRHGAPPMHYLLAQDTQNEGLPRPKDEDEALSTIRTILERYHQTGECYYASETATVMVHGQTAEVISLRHRYHLDPRRLRQLYADPALFDMYHQAAESLAGVQPVQIAGGLCLESLISLGIVTKINEYPLTDELHNTLLRLMYQATQQVICGYPDEVIQRLSGGKGLLDLRTSSTDRLHHQANALLQASPYGRTTSFPR